MEFDDNNVNIIGLNLPLKDSQGYAGLFLRYFSTFGALVCDTRSDADYRINMFTDLMIAAIPENDTRDKLKEYKKQLIKEKLEELDSRDLDDKNRIIVDVCMDVVGEISGYLDTYLGASKKIGVSVEAVYPQEYYNIEEQKEDKKDE